MIIVKYFDGQICFSVSETTLYYIERTLKQLSEQWSFKYLSSLYIKYVKNICQKEILS